MVAKDYYIKREQPDSYIIIKSPAHIASVHCTETVSVMEEIDRSVRVPFLLRVFWRMNRHNPTHEYKTTDGRSASFPLNEVQMYTWSDATLRELTELLKSTVGDARSNRNASLEFTIMALRNTVYVPRNAGKISLSRAGPDDEKTLNALQFDIGDCIDVAIFLPTAQYKQRL